MTRSWLYALLAADLLVACGGGDDAGCEEVAWYADVDADGFGGGPPEYACRAGSGWVRQGGDCDDGDRKVYPGAPEVCDGVDQSCDGVADEGLMRPVYADADGDGYGDRAVTIEACDGLPGFVDDATDCDDGDAAISPAGVEACDGIDNDCDGDVDELEALVWYRDGDGDGYGDPRSRVAACPAPPGHVAVAGDCDDDDETISPEGVELCDGRDNDCNGLVDDGALDPVQWYRDGDRDGYGTAADTRVACDRPAGYSAIAQDCDDDDGTIFPGAPELCDGVDQDCDVEVDEDPVDAQLWYLDRDGDGYGVEPAVEACMAPAASYKLVSGDCDDSDVDIHPGAREGYADGIDGNCDGFEECWLDADSDGWGSFNTLLGSDLDCDDALEAWTFGDCRDSDPSVNPDAEEIVYDGLDNDCDKDTLDDDLDEDGFDHEADCDDLDPNVNPIDLPDFLTDVTVEAGLDILQWDPATTEAVCGSELMAGGAAAGDFDDDGYVDLFLPRIGQYDRLLRNRGDGTFEDATAAWGIGQHKGSSNAALWVDLDGNGWLDLVVASVGDDPVRAYFNDGSRLSEQGAARGIATPVVGGCAHTFGLAAGDVDGDGDLDLLITGWFDPAGSGNGQTRLLANDGAGQFTDITAPSGLTLASDPLFGAVLADLDEDGDLDLVASGDRGQSSVWLGNGNGTFVDASDRSDLSRVNAARGIDLADSTKDGLLDWLVTGVFDTTALCDGLLCTGNQLLASDGAGGFVDAATAAGLQDGGFGWSGTFWDYDLDGGLDVLQTNGRGGVGPAHEMRVWHLAYSTHTDVACSAGVDRAANERGAIVFDYDNDGDRDVFVVQSGRQYRLLRNDHPTDERWIRVSLSHPGSSNPFGVGAVLWIRPAAAGNRLRREIKAHTVYAASGPPEALLGLGALSTPVSQIRVVWPDGFEQTLRDVPSRQHLVISR